MCNNILQHSLQTHHLDQRHTTHDDDQREDLEDYQKSTVEWYTYDKVPSQGWQEYKKTYSKNNATIDVLTRRCENNK